jgi:putative membrane protein
MIIVGLVLTGIAALIHVYIFYLESLAWTGRRAAATFGIRSAEEAQTTRALAFNQGFYNLFLAVAVAAGTVVLAAGSTAVGATLVFVGAGSMAAAGLVLLLSSPSKARAALIQLAPPLLGVIALAIGLAL